MQPLPLPPLPAMLPVLPMFPTSVNLPPLPSPTLLPPPRETPQRTVYVNHLVQKGISVDTIKSELRALFESCGTVVDVHAIKHYRTRGQAWIIFDSVESATKAIDTMNGYLYHGRAFQCNFAKSKSTIVAKEDGTYVEKRKKRKRGDIGSAGRADGEESSDGEGSVGNDTSKKLKAPPKHVERVAPHRILFAYELPDNCNQEILNGLFVPLAGFKEVRHLPTRNVAFIEFVDVSTASYALSVLKSHRLNETHPLRLNFAKQ